MMIDNRHRQGDYFEYNGKLVFDTSSEPLDLAKLVILATVSKSHGGIEISELDVNLSAPEIVGDVTSVDVKISVDGSETEIWPVGPVTMVVTVTYDGRPETGRPVRIYVTGKDML